MTLAEWMRRRPTLTMTAFADVVGVSHPTVSRWLRGVMVPSWPQVVAIYYATDREVMPNDWLTLAERELKASADPRQVSLLSPSSRKAA